MTEIVQVILESECTDVELAAVTEAFESAGIPAQVEASYSRRAAEVLPWLIEIEKSAKYLAAAITGGLLAAPGADAWTSLKRLVGRLYKARKDSRGNVVVRDPDTNTEIALERDLPDEAYQRLLEIESPRAPQSGIPRWDRERRQWVDPLAGLLRCGYPGCTAAATEGRVRQLRPTAMERREFCDPHAVAADLGDEQRGSEDRVKLGCPCYVRCLSDIQVSALSLIVRGLERRWDWAPSATIQLTRNRQLNLRADGIGIQQGRLQMALRWL
jgi:hypothetical protein